MATDPDRTGELGGLLRAAQEMDWKARADAITGLRGCEQPEALDAVKAALDDSNLAVVEAAVSTLLANRSAEPLLSAMERDDEVGVFVTDLVADTRPAWLVDHLMSVLSRDGPREVRIGAVYTLAFVLEAQRSLPRLTEVAAATDVKLAEAACEAIGHLSASPSGGDGRKGP